VGSVTEVSAGPQFDVARILSTRSIRMAFQPIVNLASRERIGFEALARFPSEEVVSPQLWFEAAAAQGLTLELELLAASSALGQLGELPRDAFVTLNVSPATAGSSELRKLIDGLEPGRVVLEVKEGETTADYVLFTEAIEELRSTGVRVAVDDAGLAEVSLRHTLDVRPDIIKLDTDVTRGIDLDPIKQAIVMAFSSMASQAGATSLAEGIETEEELKMLLSLEVEAGQGYLLGRPAYLDNLGK
jgi:EAL domain-containing protein (putative c-di-GMP-specific phosphodiesterase class I)